MYIQEGKGHFGKGIDFLGSPFEMSLESDHFSPLAVLPSILVTSISHLHHCISFLLALQVSILISLQSE